MSVLRWGVGARDETGRGGIYAKNEEKRSRGCALLCGDVGRLRLPCRRNGVETACHHATPGANNRYPPIATRRVRRGAGGNMVRWWTPVGRWGWYEPVWEKKLPVDPGAISSGGWLTGCGMGGWQLDGQETRGVEWEEEAKKRPAEWEEERWRMAGRLRHGQMVAGVGRLGVGWAGNETCVWGKEAVGRDSEQRRMAGGAGRWWQAWGGCLLDGQEMHRCGVETRRQEAGGKGRSKGGGKEQEGMADGLQHGQVVADVVGEATRSLEKASVTEGGLLGSSLESTACCQACKRWGDEGAWDAASHGKGGRQARVGQHFGQTGA